MNRTKFTRLLTGFTAAMMAVGMLSTGVFAAQEKEDTLIRIFHTNDVHSRYDVAVNEDGTLKQFGYARMKTLINTNSKGADKVLVLDAGDTFHGQPFATLNRGLSIAKLLDQVGYDAMAAGNHDFNYGASRTPMLARAAKTTLLNANVIDRQTGDLPNGFQANKMYRAGDVKIGVFGLATPETAYKTNPNNVKSVKFTDPVSAARNQVKELKNKGADVIICVGHLGIDEESYPATSTNVLQKVKDIDLFIDGHSHTAPDKYQPVNGTTVVSCGEYMEYLGMVDITVSADKKEVHVESKPFKASDFKENDIAPDAKVQAAIDSIRRGQEKQLGQVVANTPVALDGERGHVRTTETNLSRLLTDAMRAETGADVALTNGGGIRASIDQGPITVGEVQNVLPFGNYIVTVKVSGKDLRAAVEHGLPGYQDGALEQLGRMSQFSGMEVSYDPSLPQGKRILSISVNGKPLSDSQTYLVATNDFMAVGGDDYTMLKKPIVNEFSALDEAVIKYLNEKGADAINEVAEQTRLSIKKGA